MPHTIESIYTQAMEFWRFVIWTRIGRIEGLKVIRHIGVLQ
jgi:hypothetical protein